MALFTPALVRMGAAKRWLAAKREASVPLTMAWSLTGVALSPVLLPIALLQLAAEKKRMQAAARRTPCARCGSVLTEGALVRAEDVWAAHMAQLRQSNPTLLFRVMRPYDAICTTCGQAYKWLERSRTWEAIMATDSSGE